MNKAELFADLKTKVVKVISIGDPNTTNGGDKEYPVEVLAEISHNVCKERTIPIRVLNEGTPEEQAYYVAEPPSNRDSIILKALGELQAAGTVTVNDLSHLGINFADVNLDGAKQFVTILNEASVVLPGA